MKFPVHKCKTPEEAFLVAREVLRTGVGIGLDLSSLPTG